MDTQCEAAKLLMQHVLRDVRLLRANLPPACAAAALDQIERVAHSERRLAAENVYIESCSCLLREYTET